MTLKFCESIKKKQREMGADDEAERRGKMRTQNLCFPRDPLSKKTM